MPTIEDALEISGIEVLLHPGGYELSRGIGDIADIKGKKVLDVACGRGAFACYYARNFSTGVIGVDINPEHAIRAPLCTNKKIYFPAHSSFFSSLKSTIVDIG